MSVEEILENISTIGDLELDMLEENITPASAAGSGFGLNCKMKIHT